MTKEELEKENAELKERLKEHENIGNSQFWENVWSWKTRAEQLTNAKEVIREFVEWFRRIDKEKKLDDAVITEAEQFLSEVEK